MSLLDYEAIVSDLESRGTMPERPPSLERMKVALNLLFLPDEIDSRRVVLVAGTNGKGSVCASLEALFVSARKRVGLFTSPHLIDTTERFRINGEDISREVFVELFNAIEPKTKHLRLSHFEALTLMAAWLFFKKEKRESFAFDLVIFEVGLGGLWDATNALPHHYVILTPIGRDHERLLGSTKLEIARNKLGVIGPGAEVVHVPFDPEIESYACEVKRQTECRYTQCISFTTEVMRKSNGFPQFFLNTSWGTTELALPGERGAENGALALTFFSVFGFDPRPHLRALEAVRWPGRMELVSARAAPCPIYLSGDHNPDGIISLLKLLDYYPKNHLHLILGFTEDKDFQSMLSLLLALPKTSLYLTTVPVRGRALEAYGEWKEKVRACDRNPFTLFEKILSQAKQNDLIVISGSLYLIGAFKKVFRDEQ